jgi:hypothetical protein
MNISKIHKRFRNQCRFKFQFGIFCQRSSASATTTTIVNTCKVHFEESFQSNDDSVISLDSTCGPEYFPTPQKGHQLVSINNLIRSVHGRDVSPIRAQLRSPIRDVSQSTARYYKRKSLQTCIATLECIAPGQSNELFEIISSDKFERNTVAPENEVVQKLVTLYQDTSSRTTRLEILSIFSQDYSKSQLKQMMPGVTTWRIDEARKHAALYGAGTTKEIPKTHRTRLNPAKVDHFIDFISQPHFLQDVAFGTRTLKLSNGTTMEIPNVVRTVTSSRLVDLYIATCKENDFEYLGRSTLFSILKVFTQKYFSSFFFLSPSFVFL